MQVVQGDFFQPAEEEVQLPSQKGTDNCVVLRRPDLIALIGGSNGDVPDVLSTLVLNLLNPAGGKKEQALELNRETLPQMMGALNTVAIAAFVTPALWLGTEQVEGKTPVSWIPFNDKAFVFAWALGGEYQGEEGRFVRNRTAMLELYQRSKEFRLQPSEAAGVRSPWLAWQFDRAVHLFGATVLGRWNERDRHGNRVYWTIEECMGLPAPPKPISLGAMLGRARRKN